MSSRQTYEEAKQTLSQIQHRLATEPLTATRRKELELSAANLADLISPFTQVQKTFSDQYSTWSVQHSQKLAHELAGVTIFSYP